MVVLWIKKSYVLNAESVCYLVNWFSNKSCNVNFPSLSDVTFFTSLCQTPLIRHSYFYKHRPSIKNKNRKYPYTTWILFFGLKIAQVHCILAGAVSQGALLKYELAYRLLLYPFCKRTALFSVTASFPDWCGMGRNFPTRQSCLRFFCLEVTDVFGLPSRLKGAEDTMLWIWACSFS